MARKPKVDPAERQRIAKAYEARAARSLQQAAEQTTEQAVAQPSDATPTLPGTERRQGDTRVERTHQQDASTPPPTVP